ncbi:MAG: hypothetical protein CL681_27055 [Blastopirellula sp.]|nr:hypothetical protein [Blastopirellula sp.]
MQGNEHLREQMDACRPGKLDEMCPEMSHLAAALEADAEVRAAFAISQQFDQHVQEAFQTVEVPSDLADRILSSLENSAHVTTQATPSPEAPSVELQASTPTRTVSEPAPAVALPTSQRKRRRRHLLWGATALTAASLLCATMIYYDVFTPKLTIREVCQLTPKWLERLDDDDWQTAELESVVANVSPAVGPVNWSSWQATRIPLGTTQVLQGQCRDSRVYLLISRAKRDDKLATAPPQTPVRVTGRFSIGVWGHGDHLYVLAVEGNERAYHRALRKFETFM